MKSLNLTSSLANILNLLVVYTLIVEGHENEFSFTIRMKGARPIEDDAYLCTLQKVPDSDDELWVTGFVPHADPDVLHHLSIYGCEDKIAYVDEGDVRECMGKECCLNPQKLYSWRKKSISFQLPEGIGFKIGKNSTMKYFVIQSHYKHRLELGEEDNDSGFTLTITKKRQKNMAGVVVMYSNEINIPPHSKDYGVDMSCLIDTPVNITVFATAIHTHTTGVAVSVYAYEAENKKLIEIERGNPLRPDAFFPLKKPFVIKPRDLMVARCTYDTSTRNITTSVGFKNSDEMCNVFFLFYTDDIEHGKSFIKNCEGSEVTGVTKLFPANVDERDPDDPFYRDNMSRGWIRNNQMTMEFEDGRTWSI